LVTLFVCGDVMTGRGIDQILPYPSDHDLYESLVRDARDYVALAEKTNGPINRPVSPDYIWGDALSELNTRNPDARIINLETSITTSNLYWPKGINYRMHPDNAGCLSVAGVDCCVLANNHLLDWGRAGLTQTLATLEQTGIRCAGAGPDVEAADFPAVLPLSSGERLLVFSSATGDSGVPAEWAATREQSGVSRLPDLSRDTLDKVTARINAHRRTGDIIIFSVHWGANWWFDIPGEQQQFARGLVDQAGVDLVHGHSSHHVKGFEVYQERLILYGCGDFITDYEGIAGHGDYRGELGLMYFPRLDRASGRLMDLEMVPTRMRRLRIERATGEDQDWLADTIRRQCGQLGTAVQTRSDGVLGLFPF